MSNTVLKLRVDGRDFDANIKSAQKGLQGMEQSLKHAGKSFKDASKDSIEYVRSLGKMETKSNTVRGKVGELSKAYTELRAQYNRLTAEEKRGDFGKALNKSLEQLRARVHEARTELNGISRELSGGMGNMGGAFNLEGMTGGLTKFAGTMGLAISAAGLFKEAISNNISTAMEFEDSISKLSSLTGMVGEDLDRLKGYAIELGGSTTQSASQVAQAFMLIGSQKPELLKDSEALRDVTKAAITLGEAANIDVTEAAKALTASLNIMGQGADQANRYINVLAAGSKEGAVDINGLTEIVFKAGQAATMNKLSFEQLIAVAEQIGPSFGSSAEAGTALNAMLLKLETQTNNKYKPSVVGLEEALKNLKEANLSASAATKLVTETGYKALVPLLKNTDALGNLTSAITGTNTAEDQAKTNTDNLKGSLASLESAWERFNLTLNDSNGFLRRCVDLLAAGVNWMSDFSSKTDMATQALKRFNKENNSDNSSFHNAGTRGQQIGAYNKRKHALDAEIEKTQKDVNAFDKGRNDTRRSALVRSQQEALYTGANKKLQALIEERRKLIEDGKRTFYPTDSPSTNNDTIVPTTTGTGKKTKTPKAKKTPKPKVEGTEEYWANLFNFDKVTLQNLKLGDDTIKSMMATLQQMPTTKTPFDYLTEDAGALSARITEIQTLLASGDLGYAETERLRTELEKLQALDLSKAVVPLYKFANNFKTSSEGLSDEWTNAANAIMQVGQAISQIENPVAKVAGTIAQAIATMVLSYSQALEQASKLGPWAWVAFGATGLAQLLTSISAIKSATSEYHADGGFVGGGPRGTDRINTWLTEGELVLNKAQQSNLATQLQANAQQRNDNLGVRVRGEDMYTAIDNYMRRTGKRFSA